MNIVINYWLWNSSSKKNTVAFDPEDYFDPLDPEENYEDHGIARYDHAYQYLPIESGELARTELIVKSSKGTRAVKTEFLPGSKGFMIQIEDASLKEQHEVIVSTDISAAESHILRMQKVGDSWALNTNVVIDTHPDGTQSERKFHRRKVDAD